MFNLISNAIKYRKLSTPTEINIYVDIIKYNIIIKVADNGQGIDLEKHGQYIFGLYKRFAFEVEGKGFFYKPITKENIISILNDSATI